MLALSIFEDFWLPNATTWFYFSLLLAVALFFKFSRLLSVRNWDVLTLFLLVPGLLLVRQEAKAPPLKAPEPERNGVQTPATTTPTVSPPAQRFSWGYLALLCGSAY